MLRRNQVRIIAGQWRGRKVHFPASTQVRPTGDRIRETLFNWLQQDLIDQKCLDCFAGSGILGIEALSRGAAHVTFLDSDRHCIAAITENLQHVDCDHYTAIQADTLKFNGDTLGKFDIVFIDPPFSQNLIAKTCDWLRQYHLITPNTLIYIESKHEVSDEKLQTIKQKKSGAVYYGLFKITDTP